MERKEYYLITKIETYANDGNVRKETLYLCPSQSRFRDEYWGGIAIDAFNWTDLSQAKKVLKDYQEYDGAFLSKMTVEVERI